MQIQRIRNLTTGIIHTKREHVQEDFEFLVGHEIPETLLPEVAAAIMPWFRERLTNLRFFDGILDLDHTGEVEIDPMTKPEREALWGRYLNNCPRGHATSNE